MLLSFGIPVTSAEDSTLKTHNLHICRCSHLPFTIHPQTISAIWHIQEP